MSKGRVGRSVIGFSVGCILRLRVGHGVIRLSVESSVIELNVGGSVI